MFDSPDLALLLERAYPLSPWERGGGEGNRRRLCAMTSIYPTVDDIYFPYEPPPGRR